MDLSLVSLSRTSDNSPLRTCDSRFRETRHQVCRLFLDREGEDGKPLHHGRSLAVRFFDKVGCDAPPGEDGTNNPKVGGNLNARLYTAAIREEAARYCGANSERRQHAT